MDINSLFRGGKSDAAGKKNRSSCVKDAEDHQGHLQTDDLRDGRFQDPGKNSADVIASVFGREDLYRIGGDEFVVVMEGKERQAESTHLLQEFMARIQDYHERKGLKPWEQVYAAAGIADYTSGKDTCTEDVLKRADMAMYTKKVEMKAARTE